MRANKTDANDADGLAHLVRAGWYKEVRVKSRDAMLSKAVSAARRQLLDIPTNLSNQVRGLMKTFRPCRAQAARAGSSRPTSAGSSTRNKPWHLSSGRFWMLGAPSASVPPSSTGSCSVRCATTQIADGS